MAQRVQEYRSDEIVVRFDPNLCFHAGECSRRLPGVFRPRERRWVQPEHGTTDEIVAVVEGCPSGALHYERLDGGEREAAARQTTVRPQPNGPLYVRGELEVLDVDGTVVRRDTRMAFCRCGHSANKPFCDNSHRARGWVSEPPVGGPPAAT